MQFAVICVMTFYNVMSFYSVNLAATVSPTVIAALVKIIKNLSVVS